MPTFLRAGLSSMIVALSAWVIVSSALVVGVVLAGAHLQLTVQF